jgi:hypothetical protein
MADQPRWRNVHLVSDGTPRNTRITDEDGKEIKGIVSFRIEMDVDSDLADLYLELRPELIDIDSVAERVRFFCPLCSASAIHDCKTGTVQDD